MLGFRSRWVNTELNLKIVRAEVLDVKMVELSKFIGRTWAYLSG